MPESGRERIMSGFEFIALGTSSQVPTRERNQNAYLLRWNGSGFLLDPGEGVQRQLTFAGVAAGSIHIIGISHFHGDHCLGLAGLAQRLSLEQCSHPVHIFFPGSGREYLERILGASIYQSNVEWILHPVETKAQEVLELSRTENYILKAHPLHHGVPTIGFRIEEPEGLRFLPEKLELAGVQGPMVRELRNKGWIQCEGRVVHLEEVAVPRSGRVFAFVMDTRPCSGAVALAKQAGLLVMEATYAAEHGELAEMYYHSTAAEAAMTARAAGAHRLALTHFSQRYCDTRQHVLDAREIHPNVVALNDLDRLEIPL
jgi:ribonuclease Z